MKINKEKGEGGGGPRIHIPSLHNHCAWEICLLSMQNMYTLLVEMGGGRPQGSPS